MNFPSDPTLHDRISKAGKDIYYAVMRSLEGERGHHLPTAIAGAAYLAGTAIRKSANSQSIGPEVLAQIMNQVAIETPPAESIPQGHQPQQSYEALIQLLLPQFESIMAKHAIPFEARPITCVYPVAQLIIDGKSYLPPAVGKAVATTSVEKAFHSEPPPPIQPEINSRDDFFRLLHQTEAELDYLASREPAYPVWQGLYQQVKAMRQWSANCNDPTPEQCSRISIGLIAVRELEPATTPAMYDLITRLHLLSYYWHNWHQRTPAAQKKPSSSVQKGATMLLLGILLAGGALVAVRMIAVKYMKITVLNGSPYGPSVVAGKYVATLIQTLEPYVVSLNRNPSADRYTASLFLYPLDGSSSGRKLELATGLRGTDIPMEARILGWDGVHLWLLAKGIQGLDPKTERLLTAKDLGAANPSLRNLPGVDNSNNPLISPNVHRIDRPDTDLWSGEDAQRRLSFRTRLLVRTPDYNRILEVEPDSLKAVPATGETNPLRAPGLSGFLCQGPFRLPDNEYRKANFFRDGPTSEPIQLTGPDSFLIVYSTSADMKATLAVARVDRDGKRIWSADTGIHYSQLQQILTAPAHIAMIGKRNSEPGKVPEPVLVTIDKRTGAIARTSLWQ